MVYDNIGEVIRNFFAKFDLSVITEKVISILLTMLLFFIIWRICLHLVTKFFSEKNPLTTSDSRRRITLLKSFKSFITWSIVLICMLVIMSYFIDIGALLAVAGVGTIAIGFAAQSIVEDVMSGFMIILEDQFNVGDYVRIDEHYGTVEKISVRTTAIRQTDGGVFTIYNGQIKQAVNYSKGAVIAGVNIGVGSVDNIDRVIQILKEGCSELARRYPELFKKEPTVVGVTGMDASSITLRVIADSTAPDTARCESLLYTQLKDRLSTEGVKMPFSKIEVLDPSVFMPRRDRAADDAAEEKAAEADNE